MLVREPAPLPRRTRELGCERLDRRHVAGRQRADEQRRVDGEERRRLVRGAHGHGVSLTMFAPQRPAPSPRGIAAGIQDVV